MHLGSSRMRPPLFRIGGVSPVVIISRDHGTGVREGLDLLFAHTLDPLVDVGQIGEMSVGFPFLDNVVGDDRADASNRLEGFLISIVQVDHGLGCGGKGEGEKNGEQSFHSSNAVNVVVQRI